MRSLERTASARCFAVLTCLSVALGATACGAGTYVWVDDLADRDAQVRAGGCSRHRERRLVEHPRLQPGRDLDPRPRSTPTGRSLPLVGEVVARGERPGALARAIEARLKPFIVSPSVSITVEESLSERISVLGEVAHPGVFPMASSTGVLQALALAGGVTEYADRDRVFVLRARPGKPALRIGSTTGT